MTMLDAVWKPWFVHRPQQLARRALAGVSTRAGGYRPLRTSWGGVIHADATRTIGDSIYRTGVYDIAVSEALVRLIEPGDTVIDAGANVGYMTVLAASTAGATGRVLGFEPHPALFDVARRNADGARATGAAARIELQNAALGDRAGTVDLLVPDEFATNDGVARVVTGDAPPGTRTIAVPATTVDDALGSSSARVMKLDVEGYELPVLQGADRALRDGRIRHVVFEDYEGVGSEVVALLRARGYAVLSLGWTVWGPKVQPIERGVLAVAWEPPSFIATLDEGVVVARFAPRGWRVLRRVPGR